MLNQTQIKQVFVARDCARTAGLVAGTALKNLGIGEVIFFNEAGQIIDSVADANAATSFKVAMGTSDGYRISDEIRKVDVKSCKSSLFAQTQEKKQFIGYNMTSGSIDVINGNVYGIYIDHEYKNPTDEGAFATRVSYESALSGTTQYDIALALAKDLGLTYAQFDQGLRVNVVTSSAEDAANTILGCTVVEGDTAVSYTSFQATAIAVGDFVSIPGVTGSYHRDETKTVYEVVYVDTVNKFFELDKPYQNRSQSAIAIEPITSAAAAAGDWGISIEGETIPVDELGYEARIMNNFDVTIYEFGTTIETKDTTALALKRGFGLPEDVANAELWFQGAGRGNIQTKEYQKPTFATQSGYGYGKISIEYEHNERLGTLETNGQKKQLDIFLERGTYADLATGAAAYGTNIQTGTGLVAAAGTNGSVLNVINALMVNAGVLSSGANTVANAGGEITAGATYAAAVDV